MQALRAGRKLAVPAVTTVWHKFCEFGYVSVGVHAQPIEDNEPFLS